MFVMEKVSVRSRQLRCIICFRFSITINKINIAACQYNHDYSVIKLNEFVDFFLQTKSLNLRYNDMCNDWDGLHECLDQKNYEHGQLVLSWKRLNVSVKEITQKFFESSKITRQQILYNGSWGYITGDWRGEKIKKSKLFNCQSDSVV